jgi:hypothetical protein
MAEDEKKEEIKAQAPQAPETQPVSTPQAPAAPAAAPAAPAAPATGTPPAQEKPKEAAKPRGKAARPTNCAACNKSIKKTRWYYRNGKSYCTKTCWQAAVKKAKEAAKASAESAAPAPETK